MKRLLAALGVVVVLLAVILSVTLTATVGADAEHPPKTLVLVLGDVLFVDPGFTSELGKGVRTYQEFVLLDAEGMVVGEHKFDGVSTQPVGSGAGWYGRESFTIFGEGVIEGVSQAFLQGGNLGEGSIIGGRGKFAGATGVYNYAADFATITFMFDDDGDDHND